MYGVYICVHVHMHEPIQWSEEAIACLLLSPRIYLLEEGSFIEPEVHPLSEANWPVTS